MKLINLNNKEIQNIAINFDKDIKYCMEAMENSGLKTVVIIDSKGKLCGLISDGDIRRALYRGLSIEISVKDVMSLKPIVANGNVNKDQASSIMKDNRISFLPVIDANDMLLGIWTSSLFDELPSLENSFIIMAGGRGSRLGKLTSDIPKPLIEVEAFLLLKE